MSDGEPLIIDDYQLVNCLATGNASQVWEVQQISTSQTLAMKLLLDEVLEDVDARNTMKHEAKVGKALQHPHIIQIFDSKVTKKQGYIVMELFKALNLKSMIRSSLLDVHVRMAKLAESVTSAYAFMHEKGWIHKDIKPDNILMTKGSEIRVIDFSLASKPDSAMGRMVTRKSNIAIQGTRTYIAPELIKRERLTPAADIYSLGVTFYECLTGRPVFTGTDPNKLLMSHIQERPAKPSEFHKNISPQADALIAKMLAKKPKDRQQSMQEVLSELRNMSFFKMDPLEFDRQEKAAAEHEKAVTIDQRMDSRADHEHTQKHGYQPSKAPPPKPLVKADPAPAKPAAKAPAQPAAQAPQPPPGMYPQQMPPGMMPQYPQMPMHPGMMPPGMPQYPQMPMQPGMPPGMMPPGMPGQPGQQWPPQGQPYPPQQQPPQPQSPQQAPQQPPGSPPAAMPQQPAANVPQPPPAAPQPPPPAPAPKQPEAEPETPEDIDWLNVS